MKKAMIITVGTGPGVEVPISVSIRTQNPTKIWMVGTKESEKIINAVFTRVPNLDELDTRGELIRINLEDIDDVETLYLGFANLIDEVIQEGYAPNQIVCDFTSGTKSMSAGLVMAAMVRAVGFVSYMAGERGKGGRVKQGTERPLILNPNRLAIEDNVEQFCLLFNSSRFLTAIELIENARIETHFYGPKVLSALEIAKGYAEWDRFNFASATQILNRVDKNGYPGHSLSRQLAHLNQLAKAGKEPSQFMVLDLVANAQRRCAEGKYDDAVARLYRAVEMIGQVEFKIEYGAQTSLVSSNLIPEALKDRYQVEIDQELKLSLLDAFLWLKEKGNKKAIAYFHRAEDFNKLLYSRNHSILAHGVNPVEASTYEKFRSLILDCFELDLKKAPELSRLEAPKLLE